MHIHLDAYTLLAFCVVILNIINVIQAREIKKLKAAFEEQIGFNKAMINATEHNTNSVKEIMRILELTRTH